MEKTKRNIADALAMPGVADIEIEFPKTRRHIAAFLVAMLNDLVRGACVR